MEVNNIKLSEHFSLAEFLKLDKHPTNIPPLQVLVNLTHGCVKILEPARKIVGPIIVTSGYRNAAYNQSVGGVKNSQHLVGEAADIKPADGKQFTTLVEHLKKDPNVDQLLTGKDWLHVSWKPIGKPRRYIKIGYYV